MDELSRPKGRESEGDGMKRITPRLMRTTSARIEKLKKSFQPFWMRETRLHQFENPENSNSPNLMNQA